MLVNRKFFILTFLSLLLSHLSFSQLFNSDQKEMNKMINKTKELFNSVNTFSYGFISSKYLTEIGVRSIDKGNNRGIYTCNSKLLKTGQKDVDGNELMNLEFYDKDGKLRGKILPDFENFSLFGRLFYHDSHSDGVTFVTKEAVTLLPDKNQEFVLMHPGYTNHCDEVVANVSTVKEMKELSTPGSAFMQGSRFTMGEEYETKTKARWLEDHKKLWDVAWNWSETKLTENKGKSYSELMKQFAKIDCFLSWNPSGRTTSSSELACKINCVKDAKGNLTEIKFQFPYEDGKFYDKEQFYAKATRNSEGFFVVNNPNSNLAIENGSIVIPFEGRLLLMSWNSSDKRYYLRQTISGDLFDPLVYNIITKGIIFQDYQEILAEGEYQKWVRFRNLEQSYSFDKDLLVFRNFVTSYVNGLVK